MNERRRRKRRRRLVGFSMHKNLVDFRRLKEELKTPSCLLPLAFWRARRDNWSSKGIPCASTCTFVSIQKIRANLIKHATVKTRNFA